MIYNPMRTYIIGNIEVLASDPGKSKYWDAVKYCTDLGEGWRLPTINELENLLQPMHDMEVCSFKSELEEKASLFIHPYYWSSEMDEKPLCWSFKKRDNEYMPEYRSFWFRPVRSI